MKNINLLIKPPGKSAFTLVELIIVITILAILATIAFISFKNYAGDARDGNKLTTLSNIEKGLSLYQVKTGDYPTPDNVYGSGNYSGSLLSQIGYVGTGVIQAINMNKIPKDPIVNFEYTYGLSNNKKYYQLGAVLENNQTSFIPTTYANNYTSKVVGNYKGLYTFSTGGINYIVNLPSLIFTQTGTVHLENPVNPKFVINNGGNLVKPYDNNNTQEVTAVLEKLTQTGGINLVAQPLPITFEEWKTQSGTLKVSLGYSEDAIGQEIYGDNYNSGNNNLQNPPANGNGNANGTFTLVENSILVGELIDITNNCTIAPTGYVSSNTSIATISGHTITGVGVGSTTITPIGGNCEDNAGKTLTVALPVYQGLCSASGQIIYTNASGSEIGRVNNDGTTHSGNPENLDANGHIVVCTGNKFGYVLKSLNQGASTLYTNQTFSSATAVRNSTVNTWAGGLYQWGRNEEISFGAYVSNPYSGTLTSGNVGNTNFYKGGNYGDWWQDEVGITTPTRWTGVNPQGPCPTGYHVPSQSEWSAIITAWGGGSNGLNLSKVLKLPLAGMRDGLVSEGGNMGTQNSGGVYWTSSPTSTSSNNVFFTSTSINQGGGGSFRANGNSVRCFKD